KDDFVCTLFGSSGPVHSEVERVLRIATTLGSSNCYETVVSQAFIYHHTVFISSPLTDPLQKHWSEGEFKTCIMQLIEMAEEKTGCSALVMAIDRHQPLPGKLSMLLRAFMYLGFQLVHPSVYQQAPGFILVGYEL
ncbi:hypothetical protein BDF14DRAFT_1699636, partial [Spinellus fusiger]